MAGEDEGRGNAGAPDEGAAPCDRRAAARGESDAPCDEGAAARADEAEATPEGRWDRLRILVGEEGLARLAATRVVVVGLGGVGSACALALARSAVGSLVLVDRDVVAPSNMNRQAIAYTSTLGRPKAEVARQMALGINPACDVLAVRAYLPGGHVAELLGALPRPDYVVDCIDTISQKMELAAWCEREHVPHVAACGGANKWDPLALRLTPLSESRVCPLAKDMRRIARERDIADFDVLYSVERPQRVAPAPGGRDGARTLGTTSWLPPVMGQVLASWVVRRALGMEVGL